MKRVASKYHCGSCENKKCPEYKQRGQSHYEIHKNADVLTSAGIPRYYHTYSAKYFTELYGCASHSELKDVIE